MKKLIILLLILSSTTLVLAEENGCCVLSGNAFFGTDQECYNAGQSSFIQEEFYPAENSDECFAYIDEGIYGACVIEGTFDTICTYVTQEDCTIGNFYENTYCTNPSLNASNKKTDYTTCHLGNVHFLDSEGQIEELKETCDYDSGSLCSFKDSNEAYCKDLNCDNGRKNGESWCAGIEIEGSSFSSLASKVGVNVGSRSYRQYCLNGEIITEPCADFRQEICFQSSGNTKCELNLGNQCYAANLEEANEDTGSRIDEELCNPEYCTISSLNGYDPETGSHTINNEYAADLGLDYCIPKIAPGQELSAISFVTTEQAGVCSSANTEIEIYFDHDTDYGGWRIKSWEDSNYINPGNEKYGKAGFLAFSNIGYIDYLYGGSEGQTVSSEGIWIYKSEEGGGLDLGENNPLFSDYWKSWGVGTTYSGSSGSYFKGDLEEAWEKEIIPDPNIVEHLNYVCRNLGDCAGKFNWVDKGGSNSNSLSFYCSVERNDHVVCKSKFECKQWQAPSSGECSACGSDGLPCSEYKCSALGKNCEYSEPAGADKGFCVSSSDNSPPSITHSLNPESPIPPYSSVKISLETNEIAECRFSINDPTKTFEEMNYGFEGTYTTEHEVILNVPGKKPDIFEDIDAEYDLISSDGEYELFVSCEDAAGNSNLNPYKIDFIVMDTPDELPPVITNFTPESGSAVPYNTTSKQVTLSLNEPAECKWDFEDKDYDSMNNTMSCDIDVFDEGIIEGYSCSDIFYNVTKDLSENTRYYMKCKDQPWLEGNETELYHRNTNEDSKEFFLRASDKLEIAEISPKDTLNVGANIGNVSLTVKTSGGSDEGKATCYWGYTFNEYFTSYAKFTKTESSQHSSILTNLTDGNFNIKIRCEDAAGNKVEKNSTLKIRIDSQAPTISRVYNDKGKLYLTTDEPAICKILNFVSPVGNCFFSFSSENATELFGNSDKEFETTWKKGFDYFIKCQDFYGNTNSGCGIIVKAFQ